MENPYFEKLANFGYVVDWRHVAKVRFWRPERPHSKKKTCRLAVPLIIGQKCGLFKISIFLFFGFYFSGSKRGVLGQKMVFWGVLDRV